MKKAEKVDWIDPGYFSGTSVVRNTARVLIQLLRPPKGHRTIPTKSGIFLIAIILGVGTAAFNTSQNILYLSLSFLLSTLILSGVLSWWNFKGCRWRVDSGKRFRAGEKASVEVFVRNDKRRLPSLALVFHMGLKESGVSDRVPLKESLSPSEEKLLIWQFTPPGRGVDWLQLRGLTSSFPFGFLRKTIVNSVEKEVLVWPERISYTWHLKRGGHTHRHGRHLKRRGDGAELMHIRSYRNGDPQRSVHWKASARMGQLMVKENEQEHRLDFILMVSSDASLWPTGKGFEKMCSFAASLGEDLYREGQLSGYMVDNSGFIAVSGISSLHRFYDDLSRISPESASGSQKKGQAKNCIQFAHGTGGKVVALMEGEVVGELA